MPKRMAYQSGVLYKSPNLNSAASFLATLEMQPLACCPFAAIGDFCDIYSASESDTGLEVHVDIMGLDSLTVESVDNNKGDR